MSKPQVPTVGRRVYYQQHHNDVSVDGLTAISDQPFDAGVVHVNCDGSLNLVVTDHFGVTRYRESVEQSETENPQDGTWYWMPYQKAQHEKQAAEPAKPE